MIRYQLSPDIARIIKSLAELPRSSVLQLIEELEQKLTVNLSIEDDVERIVDRAPYLEHLSKEDRTTLAKSITGLHVLWYATQKDTDEIVTDVMLAYAAESPTGAAPDLLRENLQLIFDLKVVQASMKAWILVSDHHKIYLASRIITDIRPVFDEDLDRPLKASLITHTLKLTVRSDGEQKQVYVAIDTNDLKELRANVDRALEKGASLTRMILNNPDQRFGVSLESRDDE